MGLCLGLVLLKDIVIKVYRDLDALETQEMVNQAKVWATLSHTNIVQLLDLGQSKIFGMQPWIG